jgi:uncharacterized protein YcfJ
MKLKVLILSSLVLLLSSCYGSATGTQVAGTIIGADLGGHIGGMIGRRNSGFGGDVFGTIIGTVAGAAIGNAVTAPPRERTYDYDDERDYRGYDATTEQRRPSYNKRSSRDVRQSSEALNGLKVHNLRFVDANKNRVINSDETCQLLFEVQNEGDVTAYNITPLVYEINRRKHIYISSPAVIERLNPGEFVTYTITIRADRKLADGTATFAIELSDENGITVPCREFDLSTRR